MDETAPRAVRLWRQEEDMGRWQPSDDWLRRHDTDDLVYRVRVRFDDAASLDTAWARLAAAHRADADGVLLAGGAAIARFGRQEVDVSSGGEDALDSLADTVDEVLATGVGTPTVVTEERSMWFPVGGH